jgi:pimeloyl-ACP methyl ester carboxylesterase
VLAHHRSGSGPTLLLVHGVGSHWPVWRPVLATLEREREVVAVDLPGFGDSPPLAGEPTVEALAGAVAAFAAEAGLARPHVAGNSLGGGIALVLGAQGLARTVCALSPIGWARGREPAYAAALLRASHAAARQAGPATEVLLANPAMRAVGFAHLVARPWRVSAEAAAEATRNLARTRALHATVDLASGWRAPRPACPTTIAWGERDRLLIRSRQAPRAARELPEARHVLLRGCGHVPTWDDPEQVVRVLLEASAA